MGAKQVKPSAKKSKASSKVTPKAQTKNQEKPAPRKLKKPSYKSFKLQKRIKHPAPALPSSFALCKESLRLIKQNKKLFLKLGLLYGFITFFILGGIGEGLNVVQMKDAFKNALQGNFNNVGVSISLFAYLLGGATNTATEITRIYQTLTIIIFSLALIWTIRQLKGNVKVAQIREGFYKGMYPLVPFMLVFAAITLQFIPLMIGNFMYTTASQGELIVSSAEQAVWYVLFGLLAVLTFYMLSSSVFALYIVTLPDMTPMRALRSARKLVQFRRFTVMRKLLLLPLYMVTLAAIITIPVLIWITFLAEPLFYFLTMFALPFIHIYIYSLYRHLLVE